MFGTATTSSATKVLLLGSGELGKEVAIECQRLGLEVIALDRYSHAPAMQVAHRSYTVDMLDGDAIKTIIETEKPDYIVPEIEAIATDALVELEKEGFNVVPTANAAKLTMNREGIRRLAAEKLSIETSPYRFCDTFEEFKSAIDFVSMPCVVKPIMSSSGKGQSIIKTEANIDAAWQYAQEGGRAGAGRVIVEGFVDFDYEITLLTVRAMDGVHFCAPIGHRQEDGDYRESWQPQVMSESALRSAEAMAEKIVNALGGFGLFGVELFVKGDNVIFSEVSPRPHDTGMVTLISQDLSEFALHVRAFTGLPVNNITQYGPCASAVILAEGTSSSITFDGVADALCQPQTQVRLFGKPEIAGRRRLGVTLTHRDSIESAIKDAINSASKITAHF
ncbi:formate-dependent phosphoribosylglycinamide formyltransferase [Vibrio casei]|uniref:Formate-dependent phosphoribosylglycinamide formyltransferase n=1 Tax=Vibrio casei TaxID=673372 RepID=A0A368LMT7_9VIBR|nr:formate-dependent phosphoribosylglycinamide formyltransferase [Vibrio casei]RCS73192.1 formate-dependent phosphoribosylglycinamide formyltransferase [Vibrio casei]SJN41261.1 Phosphoribosylglycinamide formyltransferase 2 [Vibrio casei]